MNFKKYHVSRNLLNNVLTSREDSGIQLTVNDDKSITINGTLTAGNLKAFTIGTIDAENGKDYTLSGIIGFTTSTLQMLTDSSVAFPSGNRLLCFNGAITRTSYGDETCTVRLYVYSGVTYDNVVIYPMISQSSAPLPYEPYGDSWHDTPHYIHNTSTDTITTLPAVIYPTGTTATVGLKGNTLQSSIPSPTSPIMPQGTGERTGNLLQIPDAAETTKNGVTYHVKGNSLYIDGISTAAFGINIRNAFTLKAGTYTNQMYGFTRRRIYYSFNNVSATMCTSDVDLYKTFTIAEDTTYANALVWINNGVTFNNEKIDFALFESEVPKDFEPYGVKIPISPAGQTTPVYLGDVNTTRRVKKLVLTGEETGWANVGGNAPYRLAITGIATSLSTLSIEWYCSHYLSLATNDSWASYDYCISRTSTTAQSLQFRDVTKGDITAFKQYLAQQYAAGTPVCVWYVLANETTAVVNEPLMKIRDYADTVSGITIPTIAGANTIDIDTTLKPSEVSVNYHGWHPVSAVHERESGAWD